jgi:hypothetical protein
MSAAAASRDITLVNKIYKCSWEGQCYYISPILGRNISLVLFVCHTPFYILNMNYSKLCVTAV